jgi:hypothetical protein
VSKTAAREFTLDCELHFDPNLPNHHSSVGITDYLLVRAKFTA